MSSSTTATGRWRAGLRSSSCCSSSCPSCCCSGSSERNDSPGANHDGRGGGADMKSKGVFSRTALVLGLVFLYVPILSMIVYSFNNSRLVTVWDAAHSPTLKWYGVLFSDGEVLGAAWLSVRVAVCAATVATVLGTLAGRALARHRHDDGAYRHAGGDQWALAAAPLRRPGASHRLATGHGRAHDYAGS